MSVIVFLGPSLSCDEASAILPASYRGPAAMGDVYRAVMERPSAIVIIDGVFERTPAVWHKEILFALSSGIPVFGASSMGALRAAELHGFGMVGIGRVFEQFRDGELEDDDEVAVAHAAAEHGYRSLSDAMVNIRDGLRSACGQGVITPATTRRLEAAAKRQFYADRSWASLVAAGRVPEVSAHELGELRHWLSRHAPDLKRRDAVTALHFVRSLGTDVPRHVPSFTFESSLVWRMLCSLEQQASQDGITVEELGRHVRKSTRSDRASLLRSGVMQSLVATEALRRYGHEPTSLDQLEAVCDRIVAEQRGSIDRFVVLELERRGELQDVIADIRAQQRMREEP